MRRYVVYSLLFWLVLTCSPGVAAGSPRIAAKAALLMEARTGSVLFEQRAYLRRPPASTTKILTALVALRQAQLTRVLPVSPRAAQTPGSSAHIVAGERYRLGELLKGLLLRSGNDAAMAIAEGLAGGVDRFVLAMNTEASRVGALASHFVNPHGLHQEDHFVTAYDLALITREALKDPRFGRLTASPVASFAAEGRPPRTIYNTNQLLGTYEGAIGVKTGTTSAAGKCLVAAAERKGFRLIAVVLGSPDRFAEARRLLDYGFKSFRLVEGLRRGQVVQDEHGKILGEAEEDLVAVLPSSGTPRLVVREGAGGGRAWLADGDRPLAMVRLKRAMPLTKRWFRWPWPWHGNLDHL